MNTEEKAKAYNKVRKKIALRFGSNVAEEIFSEFEMSEDEKIRKELHIYLDWLDGRKDYTPKGNYTIRDMIAWLEKQGEQKPFDYENATIQQKDFAPNEDKPRYSIGDWVVFYYNHNSVYQVEKIENYEYTLRHILGGSLCLSFSNEELIREWTLDDAKDGDVLAFYSEYKGNKMAQVGIIKNYVGKHGGCSNTFNIYVGVNWEYNLQIGEYMGCSDIRPATKSQRDTLFLKMKEEGWKWDEKTHELKKIEQQTAWSEEDETNLTNTIIMLKEGASHHFTNFSIVPCVDWLKQLKQRHTWKPSEEQIRALHDMNLTGNISYAGQGQTLIELYNDLKKLTE